MANIHVLQGQGNDTYLAIVHLAVTSGNNLVGTPYRTALANSGLNTTIMTVATTSNTGPGQISITERDQIVSGSVYEISFFFGNNPAWTATERQNAFNAEVTQRTTAATTFITNAFAYFGYTQ